MVLALKPKEPNPVVVHVAAALVNDAFTGIALSPAALVAYPETVYAVNVDNPLICKYLEAPVAIILPGFATDLYPVGAGVGGPALVCTTVGDNDRNVKDVMLPGGANERRNDMKPC